MELPVNPPLLPRLAKRVADVPAKDGFLFEPKWDGFRCLVFKDGDEVELASRNTVARSMIGLGYHDTHTPGVIRRNVLENPAWYTAYTPYQPEISQGRLEALLNFQQMVIDLTGMELANASLLDEATAAAEAMTLCHRVTKSKAQVFFVDADTHPQTLAVLRTRAEPMGIAIETGKTGKRLVIQWSDELRAVVERCKALKPHVRRHLIANRQGKGYTPCGFSSQFRKVLVAAYPVKGDRWRWNDIRAKSASDDTLEAATARLGHASQATTIKHYRRAPEKVSPLRRKATPS
jgi:hypothetical protein